MRRRVASLGSNAVKASQAIPCNGAPGEHHSDRIGQAGLARPGIVSQAAQRLLDARQQLRRPLHEQGAVALYQRARWAL